MLALYRCGRQADALEAYREARSRLVADVGVEPGPDLQRLQDAILHQDQTLLAVRVPELPRALERAAGLPLEGREAELAWLRERWQQARAGNGSVVVVRGEHGIGKTRLAAELAVEEHAAGAVVLYADGGADPDGASDVVSKARDETRPTLLVVEDADRAPRSVRVELEALAGGGSGTPLLVLALEAGDGVAIEGDALLLSSLSPEAVHAIVSRYKPDRGGDELPEDWLIGASRGVPGLVHELADQWVRRRVEAGAERAAAQRADLRAAERELAADVAVLEVARELEVPERGDGAPVCPFKGLASFQPADAPYFFGRERLVAELVARLVGAPLLGIVGPSGSGKSSVLRAGLLPALAAGVLPGSDARRQVLIRPGAHPLAELRSALARQPDEPLVLAVDQFEEAFTLCDDEQERVAFVAELARLAYENEGEGAVAVAMRADFYGRCADYPELSRLLAANHVLVGPMNAGELRRAVECPAQRAGLIVDPDLVDALVADVEGEPGALPLLSTALLELWQDREGRRLRHVDYVRAGGVRSAVARLGEEVFERLDEAQQASARRVLLRLATIDEDGRVEPRRVPIGELGGEGIAPVLDKLADGRLVTVHAGTVELAHEALLREWPRLRGWVEDDQKSLSVYRSLSSEAREWLRHDRDEGALLRGARLAEARAWVDPDALGLADFEREFLAASIERRERERKARRRRIELVIGALAVGVVAIGIVALVAIAQRRDADRQRNLALSRSLAAQSAQTLDTNPELALRLALWADEIRPTAQATAALRQAALEFRQLAELPADPLGAETVAYSPDGTRLVTGGLAGVARLWNPDTRREVARIQPKRGALLAARYSRDGRRIALGFEHGVIVTDAALRDQREVLRAGMATVKRVAISPDGARVAAAMDDGTAHVVAVDGGAPEVTLRAADDAVFNGIDIDATRVATADDAGAVNLWNADGTGTPRALEADDTTERDVDFSPDGRLVLAVSEDGKARLWDSRSLKSVHEIVVGPRILTAGAFSPDGRRFATAGHDGAVRVWDTAGGSELFVLRGQLSRLFDVSFGADANRVASAGDDGTARIWNAGGITTFTGTTVTDSIDFSPTGRWIATGNRDGDVRLWDPTTGRRGRILRGPDGYTWTRFSPVADEVVFTRDTTSSVLRWPVQAPRALSVVDHVPPVTSRVIARFDPTGTRVIYVNIDGKDSLAVRDVRSGQTVRLRGAPVNTYDVRFSPDGRYAAAGTESGVLYVWRLDHPSAPWRKLRGHRGHINTVDYGATGRIVTTGDDRTVRVWEPRSGHQVVLRGHRDEVFSAIFTPDGKRVLSSSADGSVRLWDARGGDALVVLQSGDIGVYDLSVTKNDTIATLDGHEVVRIFRCPVCGSIEQVRALARSLHPRALSEQERRRFLADVG
jgi:WD40 repeat protein